MMVLMNRNMQHIVLCRYIILTVYLVCTSLASSVFTLFRVLVDVVKMADDTLEIPEVQHEGP
jgi:hypothetical protein